MTEPISVLIVDDHPVVRRGLRVLLEVQDGIEVAGEAGDGATALALAAELAPDVVLLDLKLPGLDGIAVLGELRTRDSQARVLVLTSATEPASASLAKTPRQVVLEVSDDGHGFAADAPSGVLGLDSMRERAASAGGTLTIRSNRKGTTVRMTVPGKASG